ncbi:aminoglycoside phosphotransferase family protein [Amaricoccus tamworthensis]|uniref:aminoglycoside phosphotransferase family protein n=1 Tax=Amaricoccus tamworthensis TaxID=57002 RepID=UPI003C7D1660
MTRRLEIDAFLKRSGWGDSRRTALAGDASARRYERLLNGSEKCLLVDVPPESGLTITPYSAVTRWLLQQGFSAPEIIASEPETGLMLIEDLGDDLLHRLCADAPGMVSDLYAAAIDVLADMHECDASGFDGEWSPPPYDMAVLMREVRLLVEWYLAAALEGGVSKDLADEYESLTSDLLVPLADDRSSVVYRDYHVENIIWLPQREGRRRIGLIDFQDMLIGHPAYDVVSLLDDVRRDVEPEVREAMTLRYIERRGLQHDDFLMAASTLSVQRNLKIMGLFTRLCRRDGKPRYLDLLPRTWNILMRNLEHPELRQLGDWMERHVPAPDAKVRKRLAGDARET